jgi:murein DD-endopeptidase MepM/ murein hydrolase activator NlpD
VRSRSTAFITVFSLLIAGLIVGGSSEAASATSYPSWQDVQNARASETAKKNEIATIQGLLSSLQSALAAAQALATQRGVEAQQAQQNLDDAAAKVKTLEDQAGDARKSAEQSKQKAGAVAARLAESGADGLSARLFFDGHPQDLLSELGLESVVKDQSNGVYKKAVQAENTAQSLTDQAKVKKAALKVLYDASAKALADAAAAQQQAAAALDAQTQHQADLTAQLATLTSSVNQTEAQYAAGAAAAAAARAAAEAATHPAAGPGVPAGQVTSSGWTRPAGGHISSPYGYRVDPVSHQYALHAGTDLAAGCNSPIYAAHSGTVTYAGRYGGYGNYIAISNDDGSGYGTAYGHIVDGGILVHVGQSVDVGQNIARVGSTGMSTGCHLHFEIHHGGLTQDPVPFMRARGVELAN